VVTAVSESLKKDTFSYFNIENDISVIPNFIDFTRFNKQLKDHFKKAIAPGGEFIMVHTSNFRKVKRVGDVVKVFQEVSKSVKAKLLLIGDGPERASVEKICRNCELSSEITFLGRQEAVEEILSIADLFIMTSETESFGLAALEAMACEVPVVSTNAGGLPEVVEDGFCGFTSDVGDIKAMSENAIKILTGDLAKFKSNALSKAKEFSLEEVLPQYVAIYEKALKSISEVRS
jgi:N-acetyl-alpha-D-glucosaminyl L-malate synthase BshA